MFEADEPAREREKNGKIKRKLPQKTHDGILFVGFLIKIGFC